MPISYRYNSSRNFLFVVGLGSVSIQDFTGYVEKVRDEPLREGLRCLTDFTQAQIAFTADDMKRLQVSAQSPLSSIKSARVAICAAEPITTALVKLYAAINRGENYKVSVHVAVGPARRWLELDQH